MDPEKVERVMLARLRGTPICPYCQEPFEFLISVENAIEYYKFNGEEYELVDKGSLLGNEITYLCPFCDEILAYNEKEAKKILKKEEE